MSTVPRPEEAPTDPDLQPRILRPIGHEERFRVGWRGMRARGNEQNEGRGEGLTGPGPRPLASEASVHLKPELGSRAIGRSTKKAPYFVGNRLPSMVAKSFASE